MNAEYGLDFRYTNAARLFNNAPTLFYSISLKQYKVHFIALDYNGSSICVGNGIPHKTHSCHQSHRECVLKKSHHDVTIPLSIYLHCEDNETAHHLNNGVLVIQNHIHLQQRPQFSIAISNKTEYKRIDNAITASTFMYSSALRPYASLNEIQHISK